ncbi:von Willebrand factor type A domain-containing protein [Rhodococcus maanshanensis]|uniref:von Willebrand factor type A domain-containing protein n=1 Tax=Rhodococcus maanshanensis TaxID=183556 RepID=A0A1H7M3K4_9NOCA|nr:von Willebrand factor type A domain-containing protein [Rhodococcus maanshanensis]
MGQHRGTRGTRGVSKGPVIAVGAVIAVVLAAVGWFQLRDRISDQGTQAAQMCVEGSAVLDVTADPDIAPQIQTLADRYTQTTPVVRDHCITVAVTAAASQTVVDAMAASAGQNWSGPGPAPALWIPQSTQSIARLGGQTGLIDGQPKSLVTSPVLLAAPVTLAEALSGSKIGWQDLARLQSDPNALQGLGLPGWGSLRLALPTGPGSDPSTLAAEAVAAAVSGAGAGPVTEAQAASPPVISALSTLAVGSAAAFPTAPDKPAVTADALAALGAQHDPRTGTLHAVAVTEQQLYAAEPDANALTAFLPAGATPMADHPAAIVSAGWVDEARGRAASEFADYLRRPEQASVLRDAGFRVDGKSPSAVGAVPFAPIDTPLQPADGAAVDTLTRTLTNSAVPRRSTLLLDVSGSMSNVEGDGTRLTNTTAALTEQLNRTPDATELGLWIYSRNLDGTKPYRIAVPTGPLTDTVGTGTRRQAIDTALDALTPATATSTYAAVEAAYADAVQGFGADRPNSVLLITDGPNDDTSITARQLLASIRAATVDGKPVRIDVITIGENSDADTLRALAEQTGGSLTAVGSSQGPELGAAIGQALG